MPCDLCCIIRTIISVLPLQSDLDEGLPFKLFQSQSRFQIFEEVSRIRVPQFKQQIGSSSKEWNSHGRQMIQDNIQWCGEVLGCPVAPPCIFGNVEGCIPENVYQRSDCFIDKFHKIARSDLVSHQHCYTHNCECPLFETASAFETAGLPCTDMSMNGKQQREEGPTASVFCCHAKRHIEKETEMILLENVKAGGMGLWACIHELFQQVSMILNL